MSRRVTFWTPARLDEARTVHGSGKTWLEVAVELARRWGVRVTPASVRIAVSTAIAAPPSITPIAPAVPERERTEPGRGPLPESSSGIVNGAGESSTESASAPGPEWLRYSPRAPAAHPAPSPGHSGCLRVACIADTHVPYEDKRAVSVALSVVREINPDVLIHLGDLGQWESCSHWRKKVPSRDELSAELYAVNVFLDEIEEAAPRARKILCEGNHDGWVGQARCVHGEMEGLLDLEEQLYLKRGTYWRNEKVDLRDWDWVPLDLQPMRIGPVVFTHGDGYAGIFHARKLADEYCTAHRAELAVFGHTHSAQVYPSKMGGFAVGCPWLGDRSRHVFRYTGPAGNPTGSVLGLLYLEIPESGPVAWQQVRIVDGRATWAGRTFAAQQEAA